MKKAKALPEDEREALARIILDEVRSYEETAHLMASPANAARLQEAIDEIEDEAEWRRKFRRDEKKLRRLASEALKEDRRGETEPFRPRPSTARP